MSLENLKEKETTKNYNLKFIRKAPDGAKVIKFESSNKTSEIKAKAQEIVNTSLMNEVAELKSKFDKVIVYNFPVGDNEYGLYIAGENNKEVQLKSVETISHEEIAKTRKKIKYVSGFKGPMNQFQAYNSYKDGIVTENDNAINYIIDGLANPNKDVKDALYTHKEATTKFASGSDSSKDIIKLNNLPGLALKTGHIGIDTSVAKSASAFNKMLEEKLKTTTNHHNLTGKDMKESSSSSNKIVEIFKSFGEKIKRLFVGNQPSYMYTK